MTSQSNSSPPTDLDNALTHYTNVYRAKNPKSFEVIQSASNSIPSGTSRGVLIHAPHPLVFRGGDGCYLTSLDGDEYLDLSPNTPQEWFTLGGVNSKESELAQILVSRFPSIDAIRFCNSGTEANMFSLGVAVAYTGRSKILVFKNGYHGGTLTFGANTALNLSHEFIIANYNDIPDTKAKLTSDIGAILVEPMQAAGGMIPADIAFLQFLRDEATRLQAVLIFDEVVTSRLSYGGLQERYSIIPDMTTLGKHFGGGFSFGAFGGKREIMRSFEPGKKQSLFHTGTWNNNVFSMTAGVVAAKLMSREELERANDLGDHLREGLRRIFEDKRRDLQVIVSGIGSAVGVKFLGENGEIIRDLYYFYLLNDGVYMAHRGSFAVNLVHRREHVDVVLALTKKFCGDILAL
ncbi:acetylornithine aminotransferase [Aspergillus niger ATCC 13496]|uniref:Acetylornithine aminotransferase n=1 Tax=Aspergillus niger ATCC 13496 TaxID=1353008 RepID=A0A370BS22_ASPNG|nr:acetylornithine aminotransferase [Aspergillus niger CBS 513.88]RDH17030.1 acetylornithine aminotransferase [Aspergillus niger ATCC 13496]|eukprot:XP_001395637.2 acetylornithine aminotransferase [Aspergillus niger CBS 513.88]